jgi:hypothetical protein
MALISAGAGIMGGGSSNFFTNIGRGITPAVQQYGTALDNIDTEERQTLRDAMDLERTQNSEELQRLQYDTGRADSDRNYALELQRANASNLPAAAQTAAWYTNIATPEEQAAYDRQNSDGGGGGRPADLPKIMDDTYESAFISVPKVDSAVLRRELGRAPTAEDIDAAERSRARRAEVITYTRLFNAWGPGVAGDYAARAGITPQDLMTGGAEAGGLQLEDPLGLR